MTAERVFGADVRVGDDLMFLGKPYRVLALDPYETGPMRRLASKKAANSNDAPPVSLSAQGSSAAQRR